VGIAAWPARPDLIWAVRNFSGQVCIAPASSGPAEAVPRRRYGRVGGTERLLAIVL
jgi:hypothetical protein